MDQAELEWKKLGPEYDMLLAWKKRRKISEKFFLVMAFVGVLQY